MKKSLLLLTALITMFYYAEKAQAGFLLEPYAGMNLMSSSEDNSANKYDLTGTTVGARAGFQNFGFMFGIDGRRSSWKMKPEDSGNNELNATFTTLGLFAGYDFPIMLRVWGEYVFSHEGDDDDSNSRFFEGSGTIIGVGYKVIPFVSLNLEMGNFETAKFENNIGNESDFNTKYSTYLLSVSIPLSI